MANKFLSLAKLNTIKNSMLDLLYRTTNIMIPLTYWKTSTIVVSGESTSLQALILKLINVATSSSGSNKATGNELYFIKRYIFGKTRVYNDNTSFNVNNTIYKLGSITSESSPTEGNVGSINIILYKYNSLMPADFCEKLSIRVTVNIAQQAFIKYSSFTIAPLVNRTIPYGTLCIDFSDDMDNAFNTASYTYEIDIADYVDCDWADIIFFCEYDFSKHQGGGTINLTSVNENLHYIFYIKDTRGQEAIDFKIGGDNPNKIYKLNGASTYDGICVGDGDFYKVELFGFNRAIVTRLT